MNTADMVLDFQYGSTGKGLIAGWLAKRNKYDTIMCAFATNAGHTYIDKQAGIHMMTQQLPTGIMSPTAKRILIGPGSAIHAGTLLAEIDRYRNMLYGKELWIHPHAAVVEDYHADFEKIDGRSKMGSTTKGVGEAYCERIRRDPDNSNVACVRWNDGPLSKYISTVFQWEEMMDEATDVLIEGAQGFSLSMYNGMYPYTTSRDVTPWQVAADCAIPFTWAPHIHVIGTLRTFPIRVNNRDGNSGPHYPDQDELSWDDVGVDPELTTVTKLPRRIFTFSHEQLAQAVHHCGGWGYRSTSLFLNFANYMKSEHELRRLIADINASNKVRVKWTGHGPDDAHVRMEEMI